MKVWIAVLYDMGYIDSFVGVAATKERAMELTAPNLTWIANDSGDEFRAPLSRRYGYKVFEKIVIS